MSGRFSRGRRYSRVRSYKSYPKRSSLIRRSMGNMKAAKRQNDLSNTTLSGSSLAYIIPVAADKDYGFNSFNVWNALNDSPMFRTLSSCYDQIRINNIKVKFSLLAAATMTGSNCPVFATVWDRNGFHIDQYKMGTTDFMKGSNLAWDWERFASYSSFEKRSMSSGSAFNATVSIYPSNMAEKSMYISTMDISKPTGDGSDSSEICSPLSNPALPFKPQIVTGIYVQRQVAEQNFIFSADWEIDASFRGMHASTKQVSTNVEQMTHMWHGSVPPETKLSMDGAYSMGSVFLKATAPGAVSVPPSSSAAFLEYVSASDNWELKIVRNADSVASHVESVAANEYYCVGLSLANFLYIGKGGTASDPIYGGVFVSSVGAVNGVTKASVYFPGALMDFDPTA